MAAHTKKAIIDAIDAKGIDTGPFKGMKVGALRPLVDTLGLEMSPSADASDGLTAAQAAVKTALIGQGLPEEAAHAAAIAVATGGEDKAAAPVKTNVSTLSLGLRKLVQNVKDGTVNATGERSCRVHSNRPGYVGFAALKEDGSVRKTNAVRADYIRGAIGEETFAAMLSDGHPFAALIDECTADESRTPRQDHAADTF